MNLETVVSNLVARGYRASVFATAAEAVDYLSQRISGRSVGIGGSMTVKELGLYERLAENNDVAWHAVCREGETPADVIRRAAAAEVYISSVNAIAASGEIVNIDGNCNRVASILHGHEQVYLVAGINKLADTVEAAVARARNVAAPQNAKRLGKNTPCVAAGRCMDCDSPDRICRALVLTMCAPRATETEVVLVKENLGY